MFISFECIKEKQGESVKLEVSNQIIYHIHLSKLKKKPENLE